MMYTAESIGAILNTGTRSNAPTASESKACRICGGEFISRRFSEIFGKRSTTICSACSESERRQSDLLDIRRRRRCLAEKLRKAVNDVIPPLYRAAHLRKVSPMLKAKMLELPAEKGLLLFGPPGVGKTYAMCALIRHYIIKGRSVKRISYEDLCLDIRSCYSGGGDEKRIVEKYRRAENLFIEDLGTTVGFGNQETDFSLRTLHSILDWRIEQEKATFITTNKPLDELAKSFDARLAGRLFAGCLIVPVCGSDKRRA